MIAGPRTTLPDLLRQAQVLSAMHRAATVAGSPTAEQHRTALLGVLRLALRVAEARPTPRPGGSA